MNLPTVKTMVKRGFSLDEAKRIRAIMEEYGYGPGRLRAAMESISDVLGGFGMELISRGHNERSPKIYYVNMGDAYSTTVLFVNDRFSIGDWGSIVERGRYD